MENKYRDWDIFDSLPDRWLIDDTAGSPLSKTVFITNGKSLLSGNQKRALLRIHPVMPIFKEYQSLLVSQSVNDMKQDDNYIFPAKTVNDLARKKFQEKLLKEILFDLMVCEIEDWDKTVYIKEIRKLLNSIDLKKNKSLDQINMFDELKL